MEVAYFIGISLICVLVPLFRLKGTEFEYTYNDAKNQLLVVLVGCLFILGVFSKLPTITNTATWIFFYFTLTYTLSVFWSDFPANAIEDILKWWAFFLFFLFCQSVPGDLLLIAVFIPAPFMAAYGLIQNILKADPLNKEIDKTIKAEHGPYCIWGWLGNTNYMGAYLLPQIFIGLYLAFEISFLFLLPVVLISITMALSRCKASWLAFVLAVCIIDWQLCIFIPLIIALTAYMIRPERLWDRISKHDGRFDYQRVCWALFKKRPLFGWGPKIFRRKISQMQRFVKNEKYVGGQSPHNEYAEILIEVGLVGFGLYVVFWVLLVQAGYGNPLLLAGLVAFAVDSVFFFTLRLSSTAIPFLVLASVVVQNDNVQLMNIPFWYALPIAVIVGYLIYHLTIRTFIGMQYFVKAKDATDWGQQQIAIIKAMKYCPHNNRFLHYAACIFFPFGSHMPMLFLESAFNNWTGEQKRNPLLGLYGRLAFKENPKVRARNAYAEILKTEPNDEWAKKQLELLKEEK